MNNSSQQDLYSITLNDDTVSNDTITIISESNDGLYDTMAGDISLHDVTIDLENSITFNTSDTITTSYNINQYEIDFGKEWRTHFPDFQEVDAMCKEYPALEKALENFKTIYEMVKDDYASKTKNSNT